MLSLQDQLDSLGSFPFSFSTKAGELSAISFRTFQVNIGKWCNQACKHCHVDASPKRTERMSSELIHTCTTLIRSIPSIEVVDITGGAPEAHPDFKYLVRESKNAGKHIIDRCNLTILEEEEFPDLYDFLAENNVEIVASLPHFARSRTDTQRGRGVFDTSIKALQKLNQLGYGKKISLSLVYNPTGLFLSGAQSQLEREFKEVLFSQYGIIFNNLYCINNMPINRFLQSLIKANKFDEYMNLLTNSFNPNTLEGLMCRHQISVGYDGAVYDCDFNQMLELKSEPIGHISEFDFNSFLFRRIRVANHCFGCTAGSGSSCGGELA